LRVFLERGLAIGRLGSACSGVVGFVPVFVTSTVKLSPSQVPVLLLARTKLEYRKVVYDSPNPNGSIGCTSLRR
jgi:hypothetical protein